MLFKPSKELMQVMQLTRISGGFKAFLFTLAISGFAVSWMAESRVFPTLSRMLGRAYTYLQPNRSKRRRRYKVLLEEMQM